MAWTAFTSAFFNCSGYYKKTDILSQDECYRFFPGVSFNEPLKRTISLWEIDSDYKLPIRVIA